MMNRAGNIQQLSPSPLGVLSLLLVSLSLSGCMVPSVFFPRTTVHGILQDTDGAPITNAVVEAHTHPPRVLVLPEPQVTHRLITDQNGRWYFSRRKTGMVFFLAVPPEGYVPLVPLNSSGDNPARAGYFDSGDCPSNEFILKLKKLPVEPNQK
jgi:hypothetical protein